MGEQTYLKMTGEWIRQQREALGLSQADLAQRLGMSSTAVSKWERGDAEPSRKSQQAIRDALLADSETAPKAGANILSRFHQMGLDSLQLLYDLAQRGDEKAVAELGRITSDLIKAVGDLTPISKESLDSRSEPKIEKENRESPGSGGSGTLPRPGNHRH